MRMMHIFSMKGKTKGTKIQHISDAPLLHIPLQNYSNCIFEPQVKAGEVVKKYQLIGKTIYGFYTCIHSPVSGVVQDIRESLQSDGSLLPIIIIKNDFLETEVELPPAKDYKQYTSDELLSIIEHSGIVGEGGAQFPTASKYKPDGKKINTFIINGTECEPYLTADYALMAERTEEFFKGINIVNKILEAEDIVISIEEQNKELQDVFAPLLKRSEYSKFRVAVLSNNYPQGSELQLIKSITGIELPRNRRPREAGVIVSNVGTLHAVYQAVVNQKPVISRILTVSGEKAVNYGNFEIKVGTPVGHIVNTLGLPISNNTLIIGGPMMGKSVTDWNVPATKGTAGILLLEKENIKRNNCISCGYCVEVCPMKLMPMKFEEYYRKGKYLSLERFSISSCIECAACEYICPSNVPLIESIKEGKNKLKQLTDAIK